MHANPPVSSKTVHQELQRVNIHGLAAIARMANGAAADADYSVPQQKFFPQSHRLLFQHDLNRLVTFHCVPVNNIMTSNYLSNKSINVPI